MKVLINATACHSGGALSILNQYCQYLSYNDEYILLSPINPDCDHPNMRWIKTSTTGVMTTLFSVLFSWFYAKLYSCEKLVSFSNVGTFLPLKCKVTYFHNILICSSASLKHSMLRIYIKLFRSYQGVFVVQTPYVRSELDKVIEGKAKIRVCWPGVSIPKKIRSLHSYELELFKGIVVFVPIIDISLNHKNFSKVSQLAKINPEVKFLVTSYCGEENIEKNIHYIGSKNRDDYFCYLSNSDFSLVTSLEETLCLPIFESTLVGTRCVVLEQDYLDGLIYNDGVLTFKDEDDLKFDEICSSYIDSASYRAYISKGYWDF